MLTEKIQVGNEKPEWYNSAWECVQTIADNVATQYPDRVLIRPHTIHPIVITDDLLDYAHTQGVEKIPYIFSVDNPYSVKESELHNLIVGYSATYMYLREIGLDPSIENTDFIALYPQKYTDIDHGSMSGGNYTTIRLGDGSTRTMCDRQIDNLTTSAIVGICHEKGHGIWEQTIASRHPIEPNGNQTFPFFDEGCMELLRGYVSYAIKHFERSGNLPSIQLYLSSEDEVLHMIVSQYSVGMFKAFYSPEIFRVRKDKLTEDVFFYAHPNDWINLIEDLANNCNFRLEQKDAPGPLATLFPKLRNIDYFYSAAAVFMFEFANNNLNDLTSISRLLGEVENAYRNSSNGTPVQIQEIVSKYIPITSTYEALVKQAIKRLHAASINGYRRLGILPINFSSGISDDKSYFLVASEYARQAEELNTNFKDEGFYREFFSRPLGYGEGRRLILHHQELAQLIEKYELLS